MKRMISLFLSLLLLLCVACAETQEAAVAIVNGEALPYSEYAAIESAYLYQAEAAGADLMDESVIAYFQDLALSYAVEQMLVRQDMQRQGCYNLDAETEAWCLEQGKLAYQAALQDVANSLRGAITVKDDAELMTFALAYADSLNVSEQTYVDFYRTQYASEMYHEWLIRDNPITDADVQAAYTARVQESQTLYGDDVAAFETAVSNGAEAWYKPAGYRSILQILLPATGDTAEARLASVQTTVEDIHARLQSGETFQQLMTEYGTDGNFADESFLEVGYQVHQASILWEDAFVDAAFSPDMAQPGCWSKPFASDLGVHILYYLCDSPAGPVELTDALYDTLAYNLYVERYAAAQTERIDALAEAAEIIFP